MIKELTLEEAAQLRELVKEQFRNSAFNGAGFRITQYKEGYQALANDIAKTVEGSSASVTTHRLRKFFYYTDPSICAPERLENPSFGDDFLHALFAYVKIEKKLRRKPAPWKRIGLGSVLLIVLVIIGAWLWPKPNEGWVETFDSVSVDSLKSRGWEILDYDAVAFSKQLRLGCFTAYTLRGDYWFSQPDSPIITNLILKKINCKSAKITLKIEDFNPNQDFQQAGILLLDRDKHRSHNIRVTFTASSSDTSAIQTIQIIKMEHGTPYEKQNPIRKWSLSSTSPPKITPLWIQIQVDGNKFRFFGHWGEEHSSFTEIANIDFDFEPYYVAIAAFRGIRDDYRALNNSESIPVFIDYLKVELLSE